MLCVENLNKSFGGLKVLGDINIKVPLNRITGLIGPNGAGKTTFFNIVTGFIKPEKGLIKFCDKNITCLAPEKICHLGIARTFQLVKVFNNLTVERNITIGALNRERSLKKAHQKAERILDFFRLKDKKDLLAGNLTLSDRKRLEIARAMATVPKMLLLDEVMSGLNPTEIRGMIDIIKNINSQEGVGILLIEHIMNAIVYLSDHIIVLNNGQILVEGNAKEILHNPKVIKAYLGEEYDCA
jgi:branched-chain amino acid transport system ATP-binding protein